MASKAFKSIIIAIAVFLAIGAFLALGFLLLMYMYGKNP